MSPKPPKKKTDLNWKTFEGQPNRAGGRRDEPRITLSPKGAIYLNTPAVRALGYPKHVELKYEPDLRLIGLTPTDPAARNAFRLMPHGKNHKRIAAAPFCRNFAIRVKRTVLFHQPELRDRILILDLDTTITIGLVPKT